METVKWKVRNSRVVRVRLAVLGLAILLTAGKLGTAGFANDVQKRALHSKLDLNSRFYAEWVRCNFQLTQAKISQVVFWGLSYATSKLCENDLKDDLKMMLGAGEEQLSQLLTVQSQNSRLATSVLKHLQLANENQVIDPLQSNKEKELARIKVKRLIQADDQSGEHLDKIGRTLVAAEVLYQRVLAECLLDDLKSIFGGGAFIPQVPE